MISLNQCINNINQVMSVNIALDSYKKQRIQTNPHEQLIRAMLMRLDALQNKQMKTYLYNPVSQQKNINKSIQKVQNNLKIVVKSNLQNLKMLEENTRQNWEQLLQKFNNLENKMIRSLKQKQQAFEYLEYRVISVENSQKNVTEYMKKLSEHQTQKYSGVDILQQKLKQVEHLLDLKIQKQADDNKILQKLISLEFQRKSRQMGQKLQELIRSANLNPNGDNDNNAEKIELIQNKIKALQIESKQNKRKYLSYDQSIKSNQNQVQQFAQKIKIIDKQLKELKTISQAEKNTNKQIKHGGIKTQVEQKQKLTNFDQNASSKKSLPTEVKPPVSAPSKRSAMEQRKRTEDQQDYQLPIKDKQFDKKSKNIIHDQLQDDDPFQNMGGAGIRGLLRKSKEKEEKGHHVNPLLSKGSDSKRQLPRQRKLGPISHQSSPRGFPPAKSLPPVRADLKNQNKVIQKEQSQQQQQVYQVDEDGYLIDEDGNYLYDEEGNRVQLSQDQMYSLMEQN